MSHRQIHDTIAHSVSLAGLSSDAERLWVRLLSRSDPWGRLRGEPVKVRAECAPLLDWSIDVVDLLLVELEAAERVERYEADGRAYIYLTGFDEHQPEAARKRGVSKLPPPPSFGSTIGGAEGRSTPDRGGEVRDRALRVEESREKPSAAADDSRLIAVLEALATVEKPGYAPAKLTAERVAPLLEKAAPGVDVVAEAEKLADWERYGAGARRQTKDGVASYRNWLSKARPVAAIAAAGEVEYRHLERGETF